MSNASSHVLPNGVRVLAEPVGHVRSVAIGLWCTTGSSHEHDDEAGLTHFLEHMLFKGTARRTAKQIAEEIEGRGGMLNAFTDKEQTCYYCRVLADDLEIGIDVLTDMLTSSALDPEEIAREKGVILEEIKRGEDEPGDLVHDLHMQARWPAHALGKPVIGTKESVSSFGRDHFSHYMTRRYTGGNVLLSVAGACDPDQVRQLAEERLGGLVPGREEVALSAPSGQAGEAIHAKDVEQVHFCIGADSVGNRHPDLYAALVLDAVLGSGMSSRLFQEIREKRGLAYAVGSYNAAYSSGGAFTVYGGTSAEAWPEVQKLVRIELDKLAQEPVPADEMQRAKKNLAGGMVLALEGMSARMMRMARNQIVHGRDVPIEETLTKIEAVQPEDVRRLAADLLGSDRITTTAIVPKG